MGKKVIQFNTVTSRMCIITKEKKKIWLSKTMLVSEPLQCLIKYSVVKKKKK